MDRIAKSLVIKGPLSLVALGTTVWLTNSVLWGVVGLVTSWLLVLLLYDLRSRVLILRLRGQGAGSQSYWPRPRFGGRALAKLAWLALPLGFSTMLMALTTSIPRYFVEQQLGEGELGVFAALAYFHRAGTTIVNALGQSASPRLSRHYSTGDMAGFRVLLARMIGIAIVLGAAAVLVARLGGRELLSLLYGPAYARQGVFVRLMAASGLSYVASFLLYGLTAARRLSAQSVLYVFMTGVLALACSVLVPIHGLEGAGNALLIARGVQIVGALVAVSSVLSMRPGPQETDVADPVLTSRR